MMNKYTSYILVVGIIVMLLVGDLILVRRVRDSNQEIRMKDSIIMTRMEGSNKMDYLQTCLNTAWNYTQVRLSEVCLTDTCGIQRTLPDIVRKGPVLVFRYAENHCAQCITFGVIKMQKAAQSGLSERVIILGGYHDDVIFKRSQNQINPQHLPFFNAPSLNLDIEKSDTPYCFVLHQDLSVSHVFIPEKSLPGICNEYIDMIRQKIMPDSLDKKKIKKQIGVLE